MLQPPISTLFPYPTLFLSNGRPVWRDGGQPVRIRHVRADPVSVRPIRHKACSGGDDSGEVDVVPVDGGRRIDAQHRSEETTSELQSRQYLVCRLLLETNHT